MGDDAGLLSRCLKSDAPTDSLRLVSFQTISMGFSQCVGEKNPNNTRVTDPWLQLTKLPPETILIDQIILRPADNTCALSCGGLTQMLISHFRAPAALQVCAS